MRRRSAEAFGRHGSPRDVLRQNACKLCRLRISIGVFVSCYVNQSQRRVCACSHNHTRLQAIPILIRRSTFAPSCRLAARPLAERRVSGFCSILLCGGAPTRSRGQHFAVVDLCSCCPRCDTRTQFVSVSKQYTLCMLTTIALGNYWVLTKRRGIHQQR
jgi:hypothetical protein